MYLDVLLQLCGAGPMMLHSTVAGLNFKMRYWSIWIKSMRSSWRTDWCWRRKMNIINILIEREAMSSFQMCLVASVFDGLP